jgi:hypothetical protein
MKLRAYLGVMSIFAAALPAEIQTTKNPREPASAQHFVCETGYSQIECDQEMAVLRKAIAKYSVPELGEWTWVLVRSERWELILRNKRFNPDVPALTDPVGRTTFFEEALVAGSPGRIVQLMLVWHMAREKLLDLAIRHELGHALCDEPSEVEANRVADLLEQKRPISCRARVAARRSSKDHRIGSPEHLPDITRDSVHLQF